MMLTQRYQIISKHHTLEEIELNHSVVPRILGRQWKFGDGSDDGEAEEKGEEKEDDDDHDDMVDEVNMVVE